ncbi:MAG TPA: gluconokinase [Drouetiella sp.]
MLRVIIVMGVAGSGKTTIGKLLAQRLQWNFVDADDYHPASNVEKMRAGHALTDADREPWLRNLRGEIEKWIASEQHTVLACSALRSSYRETLQVDVNQVAVVYLKGDFQLFMNRLSNRQGHFMKSTMLESQFKTLQEPSPADGVFIVEASDQPAVIVENICKKFVST